MQKGWNIKKYLVKLTEEARKSLTELTSKGKHRSRKILSTIILWACDEGEYERKRSKMVTLAQMIRFCIKEFFSIFQDYPYCLCYSPKSRYCWMTDEFFLRLTFSQRIHNLNKCQIRCMKVVLYILNGMCVHRVEKIRCQKTLCHH